MRTSTPFRSRVGLGLLALALCVSAPRPLSGQTAAAPGPPRADDAAGFKEFSARVQTYVEVQKKAASSLPALKSTDLPEVITAYQTALARKIREARPHAKAGDLFTPAACEAFRRASRTALEGPRSANARAYMHGGEADPRLRLAVNSIYPDAEPITTLSPSLLAALPALPVEVAYRVVGRTLMVVDVKSRLVVDLANLILSPAP
jgi:hypothetical protein